MKKFYLTLLFTVFLSLVALPVGARPVKMWSLQELTAKADLIVVATALFSQDAKGFAYPNAEAKTWVTVDTLFSVATVLKGDLKSATLTVQHFRYHDRNAAMTVIDGPSFIEFSASKKHQYLMFLERKGKGLYVPLTGQYDPVNSFFLLQNYHVSRERPEKPAEQRANPEESNQGIIRPDK